MSKRYFVRNLTDKKIIEFKPGIATFEFPPGTRVEILDVMEREGVLKHSAKEVAESLVLDFQRGGLVIEVEDVVEKKDGKLKGN